MSSENVFQQTEGRTDRQQRYLNSTIHADQEYIYFIGSKMIISMCYKRVDKINMLLYLKVNNIIITNLNLYGILKLAFFRLPSLILEIGSRVFYRNS